jgi:LacI family transcriptional regulator
VSSPRIAMAFPTSITHLELTLRGIHDYMREHGHWTLVFSPESHFLPVRGLAGWDGDGAVAMINTAADLEVVRGLRMPVINISGALADAGVPRVRIDYAASGRLAAEVLLDCGFRRFAYYGLADAWYSGQYAQGFCERAAAEGGVCFRHDGPSSFSDPRPQPGIDALEQWIAELPRPVGLFAANDRRATIALDACHRLGLQVPEEVAVIGPDDDRVSCELCDPPLTSIDRAGRRLGYEVAALMDRLLRGGPPPEGDVVVPPEGVVRRGSTQTLAVEDPKLRAAVEYVRAHCDRPLGVDEVAGAAGASRRWLEYAFRRLLRRSPREFIDQARVERAKRLLLDPCRPKLAKVARACGFSGSRPFNAAFRRVTGQTPRQFRAAGMR